MQVIFEGKIIKKTGIYSSKIFKILPAEVKMFFNNTNFDNNFIQN